MVTRTSAGRTVLRLLMVAAVTAAGAAHAEKPKPAQIDRNGVLILVRTALLALDQANKTGNYTVLRDLGAPAFQVNTAARLAEIFAGHRRDNLDLSGVAVIDPQLTVLPQIEANGMMRMAGFFPSVPKQQFRAGVRAGRRAMAPVRDLGRARPGGTDGADGAGPVRRPEAAAARRQGAGQEMTPPHRFPRAR